MTKIEFDKCDIDIECCICLEEISSNTKHVVLDGGVICKNCVKKLAVFIYDHRTEVLSL